MPYINFQTHLPKSEPSSYLEVGVGHGLFSSTMLKLFPSIQGTCIDISETSIKTAQEVLQSFKVDTSILLMYMQTSLQLIWTKNLILS